jgi:hypothetical protein
MNTKKPFLIRSQRGAPDLDRLARMKLAELHQLYKDRFGCDVPAGNSEYARRKIAWHLQAEKEGGLPESARQHALAIARDCGLRVRVGANVHRRSTGLPLDHATTTRVVSDHDSRLPMPGSVIFKKHKNRTIVVKVLSAGFEYDGRRFPSLSAIANEITGTKWNGFVFFGLAKEATRGRER